MEITKPSQSDISCELIKPGVALHAQHHRASPQVDGATPQPVQKITWEELVPSVFKQRKLAGKVVACFWEPAVMPRY